MFQGQLLNPASRRVPAMEISVGSQCLGEYPSSPIRLFLAKLSSLMASPCRSRKYSSVRAWSWSAIRSSVSGTHWRSSNKKESVNERCGCSFFPNTTCHVPRLHHCFSHLGLRSRLQSLPATCSGVNYFPCLCPASKVACVCAQSCPALCDPMDCSQPGSSVHGSFQARILQWVSISFSRALLTIF